MLTIKIPESTSQKSAEDKVGEYILNDIDRHECAILWFYGKGSAKGTFWNGEKWEFVGMNAIMTVVNVFKKAGYIIQRRDYEYYMSKYYIR